MSLTPWQSFVAVCRLGTISAAATELGFTQSAVSRQLAALEREVGARLVERSSRGVELTDAGAAFHAHAISVVHEADRAVRAAREGRRDIRPIVVGAVPSQSAGTVPAAVRDLRTEHPEVRWRLVTDLSRGLQERLIAGEIDVAVVTDAPPGLREDPRLTRTRVGTDQMVVVLPRGHALAHRTSSGVAIEELDGETWADDNEGSAALLRQHAARHGVEAPVDLIAADLPSKVALVATGHAIALVPSSLTQALRADVVAIPLADAPARGLHALTPARHPHPWASALVDQVRARHAATIRSMMET